MIDYFDRLYTRVSSISNIFLRKGLRFTIRVAANGVIPFVYRVTHSPKFSLTPPTNDKGRLIITLTSFPARISKLHLVCEGLLRQSCKPDMVIVWLSKLQFSSLEVLPKKLLKLQQRGVQINLVDDDIRSHKKYFYTLSEFTEDQILIVDDDILYRSTMVEDLMKYCEKYPNSIIAQYGRKVENMADKPDSYEHWKQIKNSEKDTDRDVFFGSGGGTLIPPHSLYRDVLDKELFLKFTPTADDVWLNAMARLQGTNIVKTKYFSSNLELIYKKNKTLASVNNTSHRNMNDVQIENLSNHYGEKLVW